MDARPDPTIRGETQHMTHVLVVDDSATFRRLVCPVLRDAGYEVSEAPDGMEALATIRASKEPLVVLLDVVMPRLGGIGVLNAVDDDKKMEQRLAFILVTATPDVVQPRLIADMLDRMRIPLLTKPFANEALLEAVNEAVARLGE
jgi:two-component system response regulator (stage 0 sporulation protein A)